MKKYLFSILILVTSVSGALEVHKKNDRVVLTESCDGARGIIDSLSQWTRLTQAGQGCSSASMKSTSSQDGNCSYDITDCVPSHVAKYQDATPERDGPNCWNLSLVMSGILPYLRYSSPEEMNFYMRPPLCKALKDGESRQPGDIGAIRSISSSGLEESHGFIYISEKVAYSKNGSSKMSPYALQTLDNVMKTYDVPSDANCRKNEIDQRSSCGNAVAYYRCESLDSYMKQHKDIPAKVRDSFKKLSEAEGCVSKQAFKGNVLSEEVKKNIAETGLALLKFVNEAKSSPEFDKMSSEEKSFVMNGLYLRIMGISDQLEINGESSLSYQTGQISELFAYSASKLKKGN